jgi:hypothetical protein
MKKIIMICMLVSFTAGLYAQELDSLKAIMQKKENAGKVRRQEDSVYTPVIIEDKDDQVKISVLDKEVLKVVDNPDSTYVKVGNRGILQVIDQPDSTRIRVGNKEISIAEKNDHPKISFNDVKKDVHERPRKFRGHWAGFEWGINNFLDADFTISREGTDEFMDLNTGRSWAINLNFAQYSLGFGTSHLGMLTGMGLEFNNYFFDHNNSLVEENDFVVADTLDGENLAKSKLTSSFLRIPLILEAQFPNVIRSKRIYISAGLIAGLKLGSHSKVVYKDDSGKNKDKNNDDFNISPFRYGITARIGYGNVNLFGDYYFTPMFVSGKGPELHPFTIGLSLTF